ncbi:MAG: hypothetical protein BGO10_08990 [Chlamydia sp. 32-24]|nr:MAG: hypothetical protein BGO10_08990 [Chlamydia sp. 32-24]
MYTKTLYYISKTVKTVEHVLKNFWGTILFCLIAISFFEQEMAKKDIEHQQFFSQFQQLKKQRVKELNIQDHLKRQVNSQSDPYWIELVLMNGLGLVPEGHKKVYFFDNE